MTVDDPTTAAWRSLRRAAAAAGCPVRLVDGRATPWWSATFEGHRLAQTLVAASGAAFDAWLLALPGADLPIPGRLVADCAVDHVESAAGETRATVTLLVLDET